MRGSHRVEPSDTHTNTHTPQPKCGGYAIASINFGALTDFRENKNKNSLLYSAVSWSELLSSHAFIGLFFGLLYYISNISTKLTTIRKPKIYIIYTVSPLHITTCLLMTTWSVWWWVIFNCIIPNEPQGINKKHIKASCFLKHRPSWPLPFIFSTSFGIQINCIKKTKRVFCISFIH